MKSLTSFKKTINGNAYYHLVDVDEASDPLQKAYNLMGDKQILAEVEQRFQTKAGDKDRVLTNTVASQPCCFNLFAPLKREDNKVLTNALFSHLLEKSVMVEDIVIEFTPVAEESLGDQSGVGGTDADVAVFYTDEKQKSGVILIEFKYIEGAFSVCSSFKTKERIRNICVCSKMKNNLGPVLYDKFS